jgi:hypothetical protein
MTEGRPDLVCDVMVEASLVVSCQTKWNPSDVEWDQWLAASSGLLKQTGELRLLVVTDGGHPTKAQLDRLKAVNKENPQTAIVSSSSSLRFLASALTFVNPTIRCFSPAQLGSAFDHIRLPAQYRHRASVLVGELQGRLGALSRAG